MAVVAGCDPIGGGAAETDTYSHDANSNVYDQTVQGKQTAFTFDRNRLMASATSNYDPYGWLRTITGGGEVWETKSTLTCGRTSGIRLLLAPPVRLQPLRNGAPVVRSCRRPDSAA
ncbi:hypothetical protein [Streptosporangium roseum]|uniref:hypothetical protein n=1 Tax=Streptosporangium roseum TaxID=2001 RepID=UPI0004CD9B76|nr:hypothetical protein [Streptosporangium roseum]